MISRLVNVNLGFPDSREFQLFFDLYFFEFKYVLVGTKHNPASAIGRLFQLPNSSLRTIYQDALQRDRVQIMSQG